MKKIYKIVLACMLVILSACIGIWYYVFIWSANHHRNTEDEKGIAITAEALVYAFEKNEQRANAIYLDKALEVTGVVQYVKINQAGKQSIMLQTSNSMTGVICTLKNKDDTIKPGALITIKGICTGYLSDVVIIDAVIVKKKGT